MSPAGSLPAARPLDIVPLVEDGAEPRLLLHDTARVAPQPMAVSLPAYYIIAHLDGQRTLADIQEVFAQRFAQIVPEAQILELVGALDEALMLDTPKFAAAYRQMEADYAAGDVRDNRESWCEPDELRAELAALLDDAPPSDAGAVVGVIAPHLDYERGKPCYQRAYGALKGQDPPQRVIVLGMNHAGRATSVVATGKDFLTPLGRVRTDRDFVERVEQRVGQSLRRHELDHLREHSIELQVHCLQALWPDADFAIAPFLCPDPCGPTGTAPLDDDGPDLCAFAEALAELIHADATPTLVVAGADLSHVGQRFGDPEKITEQTLEEVATRDQAFLDRLAARHEDEALAILRAQRNPTRICSVGCIYTLLKALPDHACRVLDYHQAVDHSTDTHVTCAAAIVERA